MMSAGHKIPVGNTTLEVRHCRALLALLEHGGHGRAARALGLSQSTVSEAILALERAVGARVVVRSGASRATLTTVGEAIVPHARALVATADAMAAAASSAARRAAGTVQIGATESIASYLLPSIVLAIRARHPSMRVQVSTAPCEALRTAVMRAECDVSLIDISEWHRAARANGPLLYQVLGPSRLTLVVRPGHPLGARRATPAELAAHAFILGDPSGVCHTLLRRYFAPSSVLPSMESAGSIDAVKRTLAASADHIGVLAAYSTTAELRRGELCEVRPAPAFPLVHVAAVTTHDPIAPLITELTDAVAEALLTAS